MNLIVAVHIHGWSLLTECQVELLKLLLTDESKDSAIVCICVECMFV